MKAYEDRKLRRKFFLSALTLTFLFILFPGRSASAQGHPSQDSMEREDDQDSTYFERLGSLFTEGTLPDLHRISHVAWAGRCFDKKSDEPFNSGYIFRKRRDSDAGPISRSSKSFEAISYFDPTKPANYFDDLELDEVLNLQSGAISFQPAKIRADSVEVLWRDSSSSLVTSRLRASGPYLVEELLSFEDAGPIAKPVTFLRCYYFIPDLAE